MIKRPLLSPQLKILLRAQIPADFVDWLDFVAISALLAYTWQVDPFVFAALAACMGLPYVLIGPFAGVLTDRAETKTVMILSNLGRGVLTASLFFAPNWIVLLILITLRSAVDTFFTPAKQAAIQALSDDGNRHQINGLSHGINQASKVVAPAIGGALLALTHPQNVFLINAVVSFLAVILLLPLTSFAHTNTHDEAPSLISELKLGWHDFQSITLLRRTVVMMAMGYFAMFFYDTLIAPLAFSLGYTQTHLGLSMSAVGAGGVLGTLMISFTPKMLRPFLWIAIAAVVSGVCVVLLGALQMLDTRQLSLALFMGLFFVLGITTATMLVPFSTIMQSIVPAERIGRVTALSEAANTMALLIAPFIGAFIASTFSVGMAFIIGGGLMTMLGVWALTSSAIHISDSEIEDEN